MTGDDVPTGRQHILRSGDQQAVVVEVGGGVRSYEVGGVPVLDGFAVDALPDGARGAVLVPWPNRVKDGFYTWDGREFQLEISEPPSGTAIHGLARWLGWQPREVEPDRVVLGVVIHPQPGYPWRLDVALTYALSDAGLSMEVRAHNLSATAAPYAVGWHPYLHPGAGSVDEAVLRLPAATWLPTDERQIPTGREPVAGSPYDFRAGASLRGVKVDHAFTDLDREADGMAWLELSRADGRTTRMWADQAVSYYEVVTGDPLPDPARRRQGLGAEPMTAPPNAFQTGEGLVRLVSGDEHVARWGVRLDEAP